MTNILLAIIAAVLLFGSSAVLGTLQWLAIIGAVMLVIYAVIKLATYLLVEGVNAIFDAKDKGPYAVAVTLFALSAIVTLVVLFGYSFVLWLGGTHDPIRAAMMTPIGNVWVGIMIVGASGTALSLLYLHRGNIVPTLRYTLSVLIRSPLAPFFLPRYGWRKAQEAGDGPISSSMTALLGFLCGLVVWLFWLSVGLYLIEK